MIYPVLILLFIAVFLFIGWRIWQTQMTGDTSSAKPAPYVCPACNEYDCDCYRDNDR